jgi:uncharacterized membrane protein
MMKHFLHWLAVAALVGLMAHFAVIFATPYVLMGGAMKRLSGGGRAVNQFVFAPRTTETSRGVVRPAPDLAYGACVYNLAKGPLRVHGAPSGGDYMSIWVFQANSDNIFVENDRQAPTGIDFVLAKKDQATPAGARVVISPSTKGIVLDRRLAPTQEAFAKADVARHGDVCETIAATPPAAASHPA